MQDSAASQDVTREDSVISDDLEDKGPDDKQLRDNLVDALEEGMQHTYISHALFLSILICSRKLWEA